MTLHANYIAGEWANGATAAENIAPSDTQDIDCIEIGRSEGRGGLRWRVDAHGR